MKKAAREPLKLVIGFKSDGAQLARVAAGERGLFESLLCLELVWTVGLVFKAIPELLC